MEIIMKAGLINRHAHFIPIAFTAASASLLASTAVGQTIVTGELLPAIDRWNYPFASRPGAEETVPVFAALFQPGFDDRDAQFLLGFDTSSLVATGRGTERYIVDRIEITVFASTDNQFLYDPSFDGVATSYPPSDSAYVVDADVGKPLEIFAVGYRNGLSAQTYAENTPYSPFPPAPREGVRSAFAAIFDGAGEPSIDVGRHVRQRFEAIPLAIGQNPALIVGQSIAAGTSFTFSVDVSSPDVQSYAARGFAIGKLNLMVSGLHPASGGPGGGGGGSYPSFFTKESGVASVNGLISRLSFSVATYPGADFNEDGGVDGSDVEAFFLAWQSSESAADFNIDGGVDGADVEAFFIAWTLG